MSSIVKSRKKSAVWRLFTEINRDKKVKCLLCNQILSVANNSTCSLIRHVNKKHPDKEIIKRPPKNVTLNKSIINPNGVEQLVQNTKNEEKTEVHKIDALANTLLTSKTNEDSDSQLIELLYQIDRNNYLYIFARCKECNVKARQLKYLQKEHLRDLIPKTNLGTLAEFEYLFNVWKLKNGKRYPSYTKERMDLNNKTPSNHKTTENDINNVLDDDFDNEVEYEDLDDDDDDVIQYFNYADDDDDEKSIDHNIDNESYDEERQNSNHCLSPQAIKQEEVDIPNNEMY